MSAVQFASVQFAFPGDQEGMEAGVDRLRDTLAEITLPGPGGSVPAFLPMPDVGGSS